MSRTLIEMLPVAGEPDMVEIVPEVGEPWVMTHGSIYCPLDTIGGFIALKIGEAAGLALVQVRADEIRKLQHGGGKGWLELLELDIRNRARTISAWLRPGLRGLLADNWSSCRFGVLHTVAREA